MFSELSEQKPGTASAALKQVISHAGFRRLVDRARSEVYERVLSLAVNRAVEAIEVLADIMNDKDIPSSPRVSAAGRILDATLRYKELHELAARVERIEEALGRTATDR